MIKSNSNKCSIFTFLAYVIAPEVLIFHFQIFFCHIFFADPTYKGTTETDENSGSSVPSYI